MVIEEGENLRFVLSTVTTTSSEVEDSESDPGTITTIRIVTTKGRVFIELIRMYAVYTLCGFLHEIPSIWARL